MKPSVNKWLNFDREETLILLENGYDLVSTDLVDPYYEYPTLFLNKIPFFGKKRRKPFQTTFTKREYFNERKKSIYIENTVFVETNLLVDTTRVCRFENTISLVVVGIPVVSYKVGVNYFKSLSKNVLDKYEMCKNKIISKWEN